ncbi:MAG: serine--tRNA ligase, partial [Pseudomonadota bacterium]|nr:serine--tRNA ligase [Pseudomonadota bacterium]
MHDINKIRQEPDLFCDGLKKRGLEVDIEKILKIDSNLRESISEIQSFQERRNQISKDAGKAKSEGNESEFLKLNKESQEIKDSISKIEESKLETEK